MPVIIIDDRRSSEATPLHSTGRIKLRSLCPMQRRQSNDGGSSSSSSNNNNDNGYLRTDADRCRERNKRPLDHPGAPASSDKILGRCVFCQWRSLISAITNWILPLSLYLLFSYTFLLPFTSLCLFISISVSVGRPTGSLISGIEATLCRRARMTRDNGLMKRRILPLPLLLRELIARARAYVSRRS